MRELVLKMSMSLDGFVAARTPSDWMFRASTPDSAAWVLETLAGAGIHIAGRNLFETWAAFYPESTIPMAAPMNAIPKAVFTRDAHYRPGAGIAPTVPVSIASSYADAQVASGDLADEIGRLKQQPGGYVLAQGGVEFARDLVRSGLVDEYRFAVLPIALGSGDSIFAGLDHELDLELAGSTRFGGGAMGNVYRPRGR